MLQTLREQTQGWIAGTIITIIILTFALWGVHSYFVGGENNTNVAEVNGVVITKEQLAVAYERARRQIQIQYGSNKPVTPKDEAALKGRALQALIDAEVLKQASRAQGFRISDRQIDNYLQSMPEFQIDGRFSLQRFQDILSATLLSTSEFLDLIKTSLLIDQPKLGTIFTSFALSDETHYTVSLVNQERNIQYITLPFHHFSEQDIVLPPEKVRAYYEQHKDDFMTPEQVNVEYLELSLKELSTLIQPTDTMLRNFYNENINSYTKPMQWKFISIEIPVPATPSHEELNKAEKDTEAAVTALREGQDAAADAENYQARMRESGFMPLAQVPEELQKGVAQLTKKGQVSSPFKTTKGFVIIKVTDIREPQMQGFDTVREKVRETYIHQHAEEKFAELREKLADMTYEHPDSLQYAAKSLNLPVQTSELFTPDKGGKDISQYKKVRDMAFSNDVLNLQNNSDIIQLNPETVIVLRIKSHTPSTLLPFDGVAKQIHDKLKAEEAELRTAKLAEELKAKLVAGADPEEIADEYDFKLSRSGFMGRYSNKVDTAVLDLAFRLPNPANDANKPSYGVIRLPNGYAIVALLAVKEGTLADKKQYHVFAEQIQNSLGYLEYELYKQSQIAKAKVKALQ